MRNKSLAVFFTVCASLSFSDASANVGEAFGFGARMGALAGAGVAWGSGPFAAYHNPAALPAETNKRLTFGYGLIYMQPNFLSITNVVTQNKFISDGRQLGDVDTSYRATFGQELGLSFKILPDFYNLTIGLTTFLPLEQVAYMDTGEAYIPEYVLYRARTQRPQVELGLGANLGKGFHVGAGLHMAFALTGSASVFINTQANTASSMRFTSSLKPKLAPYFGFLYKPEDMERPYSAGAVLRLPVASDNTIKLNSAARVFGDFAAVDFNFMALSTLFYDPMAIELGGSYPTSAGSRIFLQLDYQFWSKFQVPALLIQQPTTTNCQPSPGNPNGCGSVQIAPGSVPNFSYRNILVPRIGEEIQLSDLVVLRFGYGYRPSIMSDLPTGAGNYLDPSKHMLNLGLGLNYHQFFGVDIPCNIDFNFAYQYLVRQQITKTAGNEVGDINDSKIGSPGYTAGGNIIGGGVSLTLAF